MRVVNRVMVLQNIRIYNKCSMRGFENLVSSFFRKDFKKILASDLLHCSELERIDLPFRVSSSSTDAPRLLDFDTIKKEEDLHETTISLSIIQYIPGSN